ncbi:MAG: transcriptional regulator, partial [Thermotogae bacterium]
MTKKTHPLLRAMLPVVKGLAAMLGPDYEIVLHDVSNPEHSVIAIENSHVTGRRIGSPLTDLGLYILKSKKFRNVSHVANYATSTGNGKKLRSTTIFLRDENGKIIGFLCINFDTTKFSMLKETIDYMVQVQELESISQGSAERFPTRLEELLAETLENARNFLHKPLRMASKEEKLRVIKELDEKG